MINKLFFTLVFVAVLFSVSACGDDDSDVTELTTVSFSVEGLQGTWQAISVVTTGCDYADDNGTETFNCPDFCETFNFEGNTFTRTYAYGTTRESTGTFTIADEVITFCYEPEEGADDNDPLCYENTGKLEDGQLVLAFFDSDCTDTYTLTKVD